MTTTSSPSRVAASTSAPAVTPQSALTSSSCPARGQLLEGGEVQAVAFDQTLRAHRIRSSRAPLSPRASARRAGGESAQHGDEQRRAGDAVDVVVAVDADRFALLERALHPADRGVDSFEAERIGELRELRREKPLASWRRRGCPGPRGSARWRCAASSAPRARDLARALGRRLELLDPAHEPPC